MTGARRLRFPARFGRGIAPYLYIAPFFIVFATFGVFPLFFNGWIAVHSWNPPNVGPYVGLANFTRLVHDPRFWNALKNTFAILFLSSVPMISIALGLAHVLNEPFLRGKTFFRMSLLVPNVTSTIAVGVVFTSIFGRDFGVINFVLTHLGLHRIDWAAGAFTSHIAIAAMISWRWTGYTTLLLLAAMQAIPRDLYRAAMLDGASSFRRLVHITIPQLRPALIFIALLTTIGGLQVFAEPLVFGGANIGITGGSARQFQTVVLFVYEQGFFNFDFSYAAAISLMLFVIILVASLINFAVVRRIAR
jgi:cellobiose transport system permease protein